MSSTLTIEPKSRKKKSLPYELKIVLQKKFRGVMSSVIMDQGDIPYVKALVDMEVKGANDLLEYLEKYEEIVLDEQF